jgi:hypothetical protein
MIVFRYSDELHTLAAENFSSVEALHERLEVLLKAFIGHRDFGAKGELLICVRISCSPILHLLSLLVVGCLYDLEVDLFHFDIGDARRDGVEELNGC